MILGKHDVDAGTGGRVGGTLTAETAALAVVDALQRALPGGTRIAIAWHHAQLGLGSQRCPGADDALQRAVVAHLDACADDGTGNLSLREGSTCLGRSARGNERVAVGLAFDHAPPEGWMEQAWFALAGDLVWAMLRLADADIRIEALEKSKRLQQALYEISDLAGRGLETREMLARIHRVVGHLMPAETSTSSTTTTNATASATCTSPTAETASIRIPIPSIRSAKACTA